MRLANVSLFDLAPRLRTFLKNVMLIEVQAICQSPAYPRLLVLKSARKSRETPSTPCVYWYAPVEIAARKGRMDLERVTQACKSHAHCEIVFDARRDTVMS